MAGRRSLGSDEPRASIVIPNWNGARYLGPCLASLDRQSLGDLDSGAFEVIVVDNGSQDGSLTLLADWPSVRVIDFPTNLGFAASANCGIRVARAELILLLNNDTEAEPGWLAALLPVMEADPGLGMACSKLLVHADPARLHTTGDTLDRAGMAANRGAFERDDGQYDAELNVFGANAAAAVYRRAMLDQIGGFEEAFGSYMEDVDLAWRARLAGWRCAYVPQARVLHHVSATGGGSFASFHVARNRLWTIVRNYPAGLLLRNLHRVLGAQMGVAWSALRAWRGEAARATLRGQLAGLLTWPRMIPARRRIMAERRIDDAALGRLMGD